MLAKSKLKEIQKFSQLKIQPGVTNNKLNKYLPYVVDGKMRFLGAEYTGPQQAGRFAAAGEFFRLYIAP